jgi:type IV secretory pathway VirB10-like protein
VFIANALSPAQVVSVDIDEAEKSAVVVVPDGQLSLAIGKEGQNARLAAKLTGWKIDIKSQSIAEAEKKTMVKEAPPVAAAEEAVKVEEPVPQVKERAARVKEPVPLEKEEVAVTEGVAQVEGAVALPKKVEEEVEVIPYEAPAEVEAPAEKPQIRFAEDIFAAKAVKPEFKKKEKKKKSFKEDREEGRAKRARKLKVPSLDELEEDLEE